MNVYLTFDDGIQAGTEEVLDVLKETGVKATFFLIGNELQYSYKRNPAKLLRLLQQMNNCHDIGMHSFSHSNFNYAAYYENNGVQIDADGTLRSILSDFKKGEALIVEYLGDSWTGFTKSRSLARLPGRNTFCIHTGHNREPRDFSKSFCHFEKGTEKCSRELFEAGYDIFGWNLEWEMSFDFHKMTLQQKNIKINTIGLNYQINEDVYPNWDMYGPEHLDKDRLIEDWTSVLRKIITTVERQGTVILLMHDRAFRKGGINKFGSFERHNSDAANNLRSLIIELKNRNISFKGLSEFRF
ncbi:MAG TPA: polysaccharide deacetylase family protein [Niastella sp.]